MASDKVPSSRVRRTVAVGRLATGETIRQLGTRAANVARGAPAAEEALARRQIETSKQIVAVLGTLKGAAMKIGQMLSVVDLGFVDEQHREQFQRELAKLRDAAPAAPFKQMRGVIEGELGEKLEDVFESFDHTPLAAASIGQVYRAVLHDDGREVAVKVQYPGIAAAVHADMRSLDMVVLPLRRVMPGADAKAVVAELAERLQDELDYELEAQNQRSLARLYRGHPFIVVPDVITSLCRERVLVTELVRGTGFEAFRACAQPERDRIGEIVFRFYLGSLYRHRQFSGDPHPGNFLLLDDGRMAFLDFGLFKQMDRASVELEIDLQRSVAEEDRERLRAVLERAEFLVNPDQLDLDAWMAFLVSSLWWYAAADEDLQLTPAIAARVIAENLDPRSGFFKEVRRQGLRSEHLLGRRMEIMTLAALAQLRARANWHRIAREWMYGEEPITSLGREEAAFFARGGAWTSS
jgi:predicted unusual protein kinase regulating ubiquinone biosynthesis (AarF/ABC1/UbiB family)